MKGEVCEVYKGYGTVKITPPAGAGESSTYRGYIKVDVKQGFLIVTDRHANKITVFPTGSKAEISPT